MARNCTATDWFETGASATTIPAAFTAAPVTIFLWANPHDISVAERLFSVADVSLTNNYFAIILTGPGNSNVARWQVREGASVNADTGNSWVADIWQSVCVREVSATDHNIVLNADFGNEGNSATSKVPVGVALDATGIGQLVDFSPGLSNDVDIAEVAIWDTILEDDEITTLHNNRFAPPFIRPESLTNYWSMRNGTGSQILDLVGRDVTGGVHLQENGSSAGADHPRIIYPATRMFSFPPVAAAAADNAIFFGANF